MEKDPSTASAPPSILYRYVLVRALHSVHACLLAVLVDGSMRKRELSKNFFLFRCFSRIMQQRKNSTEGFIIGTMGLDLAYSVSRHLKVVVQHLCKLKCQYNFPI
jgi:tRNA-dihydrouridine synthase